MRLEEIYVVVMLSFRHGGASIGGVCSESGRLGKTPSFFSVISPCAVPLSKRFDICITFDGPEMMQPLFQVQSRRG